MTRGRFPAGLTFSMFVAAVSLGVTVAFLNLQWPAGGSVRLVVHCSAALCLGWAVAGLMVGRVVPNVMSGPIGADLQAVLHIATTVTGLVVAVLMVYAATTEVLCRSPYLIDYRTPWRVNIWQLGLIDLAFVAAAVVLSWGQTRSRQLVTVCFWILVLAGLWLSLWTPAVFEVSSAGEWRHTETTPWAIPFMVSSALLIAAFSIGEGVKQRIRRARAWPHALSNLTHHWPLWPGFHYSVGIVAVTTWILACLYIVSPWVPPCSLLAGGAILAMVARHWDESLADVAMGLVTLGVMALPLAWLPIPMPDTPDYYAEIFNRTIAGLAVMTWFWYWLASVWDQQLDHGQPWTTAGHLIRNVQRVGYLCGATGVLVAVHLAFWPWFPVVQDLDNSAWRWTWGLIANALMVLALVSAARRANKTTLAGLVLFAMAATVSFSLNRLGDSPLNRWLVSYWPMTMPALAAVAMLLAGATARGAAWRVFSAPLLALGTLVAPAAGVVAVSVLDQSSMPSWLPSGVFGALAGVYLLSAIVSRHRSYGLLVLFCAFMALWRL